MNPAYIFSPALKGFQLVIALKINFCNKPLQNYAEDNRKKHCRHDPQIYREQNAYYNRRRNKAVYYFAYASPEDQARLLTADPFTTVEALNEVRMNGYTISSGERNTAVESIAVPIFNANRGVDHALFMTGPAGRLDVQSKVEIIPSGLSASEHG